MGEPLLKLSSAAWDAVWNEVDVNLNRGFDTCYLRVGVRGGGCSGFEYDLDVIVGQPGPRDIVWEQPFPPENKFPDPPVRIAVDPISAQYLRGCVIDYSSIGLQKGFMFENPQAKATCGCGRSFTT